MYAYRATALLMAIGGVEGAGTGMLHEAEINHGGRELTARYRGAPDITMKQIGQWLPNRPGTAACLWTARLAVRREVVGANGPIAAFARPVTVGETISGRTPGRCTTARATIERQAALRLGGNERLAQAASLDRAALVAELDSAR